MVLESCVVPEKMECHPARMFIIGFVYAVVGVFLAYFVFQGYASIASVFLTCMPLIVVMYKALLYEEGKDCRIKCEYRLMKEHMHVLLFFLYLFLGLVAGFAVLYTLLPAEMAQTISESQSQTISGIQQTVTGNATNASFFNIVLSNNLRVLAFCIIFSFLYGAGAIFILTWNASVIAAAIVQYSSLNFFVHGIPEIMAYFIGALAGGIISVAVANHDYNSPEFKKIVVDSLDLIILSLLVLVFAAFIESYNIEIMDKVCAAIGIPSF